MIRRPPRSTPLYSSAASDVYKRQGAFDEGVAVEISKWFGDWNPFAEAGYTVQGKSAQLFLKTIWLTTQEWGIRSPRVSVPYFSSKALLRRLMGQAVCWKSG